MYDSNTPRETIQQIQESLTEFQSRPDLPDQIRPILDGEFGFRSKFVAVTAFRHWFSQQWHLLGEDFRFSLRSYFWDRLQETISGANADLAPHLQKIIADIGLAEYPAEWPAFVRELLGAVANPESAAVFFGGFAEFSMAVGSSAEASLTSARAGEVLAALTSELNPILATVRQALDAVDSNLIVPGLRVLSSLGHWIDTSAFLSDPSGLPLLDKVCGTFLSDPNLIQDAVVVLGAIISNMDIPESCLDAIPPLFIAIVESLRPFLASSDPATLSDIMYTFFACTMTSFLEQQSYIVEETPDLHSALQEMISWILVITEFCERDHFASCVDFWHGLSQRLFTESRDPDSICVSLYGVFVPEVRRVFVLRIVSPFDRQVAPDLSTTFTPTFGDLYRQMKDTLVYLTHLDSRGMLDHLTSLRSDPSPSYAWANGAILPALNEQTDRTYVREVIGFLTSLPGSVTDPDASVSCATCAAFVCGQAGKFLLRESDLFLSSAEFLIQLFDCDVPEVQNVALECLCGLLRTNGDQMTAKSAQGPSLLERMLSAFSHFLAVLPPDGITTLFALTADLINRVSAGDVRKQMFAILVSFVDGPLRQLADADFSDPDASQRFVHLASCHCAIASRLGSLYPSYFVGILPVLVGVYGRATAAIADPRQSGLLAVPNAAIGLVERAIYHSHDSTGIRQHILPACLGDVLEVFAGAPPFAKAVQVLRLFDSLARRCTAEIGASLERVFGVLVLPIRELVESDFEGLDDLRSAFFEFLAGLTRTAVDLLLGLPEGEFAMFVECLKWGAKHQNPDVSERCTVALGTFTTGVARRLAQERIQDFVVSLGPQLLLFALDLLTDTTHKFAFVQQVGFIEAVVKLPAMSECGDAIMAGMVEHFPGRDVQELFDFVAALFARVANSLELQRVCKDFLVVVKNVLPQDPDFRNAEKKRVMAAAAERLRGVEGIESPPLFSDDPDLHLADVVE
jgi:hypothetical protein